MGTTTGIKTFSIEWDDKICLPIKELIFGINHPERTPLVDETAIGSIVKGRKLL
jgi:GTP-dependent phosphoenolpyruvate carboxykinase